MKLSLNLIAFVVCPSIYFSAFKRLEEEEGLLEDPDYEEGQEEEFAKASSTILDHFDHMIYILFGKIPSTSKSSW